MISLKLIFKALDSGGFIRPTNKKDNMFGEVLVVFHCYLQNKM